MRLRRPARAVAGHAAHRQRAQHHGRAEVIGRRQAVFSLWRWHWITSAQSLFLNPNRSLDRLPVILVFSIASCSSFVCLSASCLSYSLDVARYVFKNKAGNMLNNQTKSAQALTTDLGWIIATFCRKQMGPNFMFYRTLVRHVVHVWGVFWCCGTKT